ncbi:hypothetical protein BJ742DRAFT_150293 [Cladochytrium replicatum]|nr:hypothetical protein BJ742DRAFT_150293 [Cladochytrium replicatum]
MKTGVASSIYVHASTEVTDKKPSIARGGILADDMGLGQTWEVISLILKSEAPDSARLDDEKSRSNNREDDTCDDEDDYQCGGSGGKADSSSTGYFPPGRRGKQPRVDPVYQTLMESKATLLMCQLGRPIRVAYEARRFQSICISRIFSMPRPC